MPSGGQGARLCAQGRRRVHRHAQVRLQPTRPHPEAAPRIYGRTLGHQGRNGSRKGAHGVAQQRGGWRACKEEPPAYV
eukprot:233595-Chlamydomonas_euryale.AAC.1